MPVSIQNALRLNLATVPNYKTNRPILSSDFANLLTIDVITQSCICSSLIRFNIRSVCSWRLLCCGQTMEGEGSWRYKGLKNRWCNVVDSYGVSTDGIANDRKATHS